MSVTFHWDALFYILICFFPVALVHELGHILAAWFFGCKDFAIQFGSPSSPWSLKIPVPKLPIAFHIGPRFWELWLVPPRFTTGQGSPSVVQGVVISAAGPAASFSLYWLLRDHVWTGGWVPTSWVSALAVTSFWFFAWPLVPMRYRSLNGFASDGLRILLGIRRLMNRKGSTPVS